MDLGDKFIESLSLKLKKSTTYKEQVNLLKKRGLIIEDDKKAEEILKRVNYYYITGYLYHFKKELEKYEDGLTFEQIYNTIKFDMKLRNILMYPIELIERNLKTNIAYYFSHNYDYGNISYCFPDYFKDKENHNKFMKYFNKNKVNNKDVPFIKHHLENYDGYLPIWVATEIFTLGNLENLYSLLDTKTKKDIAKVYGYSSKQIHNWIECTRKFRNMIAHNMRLYDYIIYTTPLKERSYLISTNRIFDYILIMKYLMLNKYEWNLKTVEELKNLFKEYRDCIDLDCIGFPENWEQILTKE